MGDDRDSTDIERPSLQYLLALLSLKPLQHSQ